LNYDLLYLLKDLLKIIINNFKFLLRAFFEIDLYLFFLDNNNYNTDFNDIVSCISKVIEHNNFKNNILELDLNKFILFSIMEIYKYESEKNIILKDLFFKNSINFNYNIPNYYEKD
jgi:hypothetical protein